MGTQTITTLRASNSEHRSPYTWVTSGAAQVPASVPVPAQIQASNLVLPSTDKKMQEGAAGESLVNRQLNGEGEKPAKIDVACVLEKARKAEIEIKQVEAQAAELG